VITLTGTNVLPLTPELALEFATMPAWRGERPLSEARVTYLRHALEAGQFHSPKWATAKLGGRLVRMNGQHSSFMLSQAPLFPKGLQAVVDEFAVDSESDLGELFTRFDTPASVRPPREQFAALVHGGDLINEGDGRSVPGLERVASAMALATTKFESRFSDPHLRAAVLHQDPEFIDFAWPYITAKGISRPPVLAAVYMSWLKAPAEAAAFWNLVRHENHPSPTNPSRLLARILLTYDGEGQLNLDEGRDLCAKCIHAWNNWRKGTEVSRLYSRIAGQLPAAM